MSFPIDYEKLLENYKAIWSKIEELKNIKLNALPFYDERYIKTKIRTYDDKIYTNFCCLNGPVDDTECEYFSHFCWFFACIYDKKYYLQVYLDNCANKTVNKQMTDYLDEKLFEC